MCTHNFVEVVPVQEVWSDLLSDQRYTFCNCHGTGCNYDWKTAGQESALEVLPMIIPSPSSSSTYLGIIKLDLSEYSMLAQCYACSSLDENSSCDEADSGELTRCQPGDKGCFISQGALETVDWNVWKLSDGTSGSASISEGIFFQSRLEVSQRSREVALK